jgi:uncharacterized protein YkwD
MTGIREPGGRTRVVPVLLAAIAALALAGAAAPRADAAVRDRRCSPAGVLALRGTSRVERSVRCLLNLQRARAGLRPLRYDRCLDRAAERHARDMVRRHYFAHFSSTGRTLAQRARAAGYVPRRGTWRLGENLAWGAGRRASARAAVRGWMHSPPHRANVLTAGFRDIGVAVVRGAPVRPGPGAEGQSAPATFVVEFGARSGRGCGRRAAPHRPRRPQRAAKRRAPATPERGAVTQAKRGAVTQHDRGVTPPPDRGVVTQRRR